MASGLKKMLIGCVAASCAATFTTGALAQTTNCQGRLIQLLDFRNPALVSGSALQPGAVYRFSNVAFGTDALVSIDTIINGSLATIDNDAILIANFQPQLSAAGGDNGPRSIDFTITLVLAGTSTPVQADFAASGIDIDGDSGSLREYSEFSLPFAEFAIESPSELDINASGPSVPGNFRFESRTPLTAPGIDETATANIASVFYTDTSTINYRIGTLGTGATTRLTSLDFTCPNINFPTNNPLVDQDHGDAPNTYGDPRHDINASILIGLVNTAETSPVDTPDATGDSGDDGVNPPLLNRGVLSSIDVAVTGTNGRLQAFIDFDGDGTFTTSGDRIATDVQDGGAGDADGVADGNIRLSFTTPLSAITGNTFARFRWGTQAGIDATLTASNGEVEDYQVSIAADPPASVCPNGFAVSSQTGNASSVQLASSIVNATRALGGIAAAGSSPPGPSSAEMDAETDEFTLDLGEPIPANTTLWASLARDISTAGDNTQAEIFVSPDNTTFTSAGIYGIGNVDYPSGAQNVLERMNITVPVAGTRYVRFDTLNDDDFFVDGLQYSEVCVLTADLDAEKTVAVYDPTNANLLAIPGNDVVYSITATNTGTGIIDANSIFVVDRLPPEVEFFNGDFDDGGPGTGAIEFTQSSAGLTFTENTDLGFSDATTAPVNFAACDYAAASGYDPNITFVCFNPKGSMNDGTPDPTFTVRFRTRIK